MRYTSLEIGDLLPPPHQKNSVPVVVQNTEDNMQENSRYTQEKLSLCQDPVIINMETLNYCILIASGA